MDMAIFGARLEVMRRIMIILEGNIGNNTSPWNAVLPIQIKALHELEKFPIR